MWNDSAGDTFWLEFDALTGEDHVCSVELTEYATELGTITDDQIVQPKQVTLKGVVSNYPTSASDTGMLDREVGHWAAKELKLPDSVAWKEKLVKLKIPESKVQLNAESVVGALVSAITGGSKPELKTQESTAQRNKKQAVYVWTYDGPLARPWDAYQTLQSVMSNRYMCRVISDIDDIENLRITEISPTKSLDLGSSIELTVTLKQIIVVSSETTEAIAVPAEPGAQKRKSTDGATEESKADPEAMASGLSRLVELGDNFAGVVASFRKNVLGE